MKTVKLPLPELLGLAATRGLLGAGLALLFGKFLRNRQRSILGGILTAIGILSTPPLAYDLFRRLRAEA